MKLLSLGALLTFSIISCIGQMRDAGESAMSFEEYNPPSTLVVPTHPTKRARFPLIDVHNHQWSMPSQDLDKLTTEMDKLNMAVMVNLSGRGSGSTEHLKGVFDNVNKKHASRFIIFTNLNFDDIDKPGWTERTVRQLEADVKMGAKGLKIYKTLGLTAKDSKGKRIAVDDPRIDAVWAKCGQMGIPVLIHSADPFQFWQPKDKNNERWLELKEKPDRYRDPKIYPAFEQIISEQHNVFRRHPKTKFINAHLGWYGNDLAKLGKLMDEMPNMYTEIGAVLAELGRQPRTAREWMIKYQDRVMFGKDSWEPAEYETYFRVLETADEYFDYYRKRHAYWKMYGLNLPDEVLRKLYYENAIRVIPGIDKALFSTARTN